MEVFIKDKIIIVIGAGLIGRAFAQTIIEANGICLIADKNFSAAQQIAIEVNQTLHTENCHPYEVDITKEQSLEDLILDVKSKFKNTHALVNCAYPKNKNYGVNFEDVSFEDFCENINMHLGGYFLACKTFAKFFQLQGHGNIINIASIYGFKTPRFEIYKNSAFTMPVEYALIKSGILQLNSYLAKYYKGSNIRFNAISPGGIKDNQPKEFIKNYNQHGLNKGMLDVEDLLGCLIFLLSDSSKYINGQNLIVDDGWSL
jgi:NAD(P)-dependent dehydrogenase (short-subunit alcohol dehydrogenase family)